ncbi:MAG TPA: hypothetical protein VFQ63_03810 [Patescibacteria group bacterium]|nr:hypothetical protein [Patescibacteria group bacterium]
MAEISQPIPSGRIEVTTTSSVLGLGIRRDRKTQTLISTDALYDSSWSADEKIARLRAIGNPDGRYLTKTAVLDPQSKTMLPHNRRNLWGYDNVRISGVGENSQSTYPVSVQVETYPKPSLAAVIDAKAEGRELLEREPNGDIVFTGEEINSAHIVATEWHGLRRATTRVTFIPSAQ